MTSQHKGTAAVWGIKPELLRGIYMTGNFKKYAPSGVAGDHTKATEGAGQNLIEVASAALARFIRAYRELPLKQ
jgi:creatinine amidohydrolase/Fe(II)-dependent formamide hydrolase-like protein